MNCSFAATAAFVLVALAILGFLALYDIPVEGTVDSRTGISEGDLPFDGPVPFRTDSSEALRMAASRGDAEPALTLLRGMRERVRDPVGLVGTVRLLRTELLAPAEEERRLVEDGIEMRKLHRRRAALARLSDWDGRNVDFAEGLELLRDLEMDEPVGRPVETFFAGGLGTAVTPEILADWIEEGTAPDRAAAGAVWMARGRTDLILPEVILALAGNFPLPSRARARVRWLLRGVANEPDSAAVALSLARTYVQCARNREAVWALNLATRAGAEDRVLQEARAMYASWASLPAAEADALTRLLAWRDEPEMRERLISLHRYLGNHDAALPHVVHLARLEGTEAALGNAATESLRSGQTELAVELYGEAGKVAEDERPWRERIVDAWVGELRLDDAIEELRDLAAAWPEDEYGVRLEDLLRRTGRSEELAARLLERLRREPDPEVEAEAIDLFSSVGDVEHVREILALKIRRHEDPTGFFVSLPTWAELGLPGIHEKALELAGSEKLDAEAAGIAFEALSGLGDPRSWHPVVEQLLERYPDHPAAVDFLVAAAAEDEPGPGPGEESVLDPEAELRRLVERAHRPDLPLEERKELGEKLFHAGRPDLSLSLFQAVLVESPDDRLALFRAGQIRAWANDPYGAIPLLERCYARHGPGDGELSFLLGEAYWACSRDADAEKYQREALALLRVEEHLTAPRESMVARILARLGRGDEARAIFDRLTALDPESADLVLDYADVLLLLSDPEGARELVARAKALAPDEARTLRLEGALFLALDRPEEALRLFDRGRREHGPDAGFSAGFAEAAERLARLADAHTALDEAIALQPGNLNLAWSERRIADRLASPALEFETVSRSVGRDRSLEVRAKGSLRLDPDRTRLSFVLSEASYRGAARDLAEGTRLFRAHRPSVGLGVWRRVDPRFELAGGVDVTPGARGRAVLAGWAEGRWERRDPWASLECRLHLGEILGEPAGAAALDGFSDGISFSGFASFDDPAWWISGRLAGELVQVDPAGGGAVRDVRLSGEALAGIWIRGSGPEVQSRVHPRTADPVRVGTTMAGEPPEERGVRVGAWVSWSGSHFLDPGELSGVVPVADRYHYLTASARAVGSIVRGLHWELEGYGGVDLVEAGPFAGLRAGLAWRPDRSHELRIGLSNGFAFGRSDADGRATQLTISFTTGF